MDVCQGPKYIFENKTKFRSVGKVAGLAFKRFKVRILPWSLGFVILDRSLAWYHLLFKFSSKLRYIK